MKAVKILILLMVLSISLPLGCGDDGLVSPFSSDESAPDILTGEVVLENMNNHAGVSIELEEMNASLVTQEDGKFILPETLAEGEWTLKASYPFFATTTQKFVTHNGEPVEPLETMEMEQQVKFIVSTDFDEYYISDEVLVTLQALNITTETISLESETSPQVALAVRHDGETVLGGLFPGSDDKTTVLNLEPGEPYELNLSWEIDSSVFAAGDYEVYAIVTDSLNYPQYFEPTEDTMEQFNESLFDKLTPAVISIY